MIADDGTPVVQLAADSHDEDHLVHELMHLKLFLEGFPIGAEWALGCDNKREFRLAEWSRMNLNEAIDHWIFYPQIRAMGMTPDQSYVNDLKKMVMSADAASIPARSLAVDYFRAKTMAGQQNLARSVREWCLAGHQAEAVKAGDAMFEILMKQRPASPDQAIETYVACANVLFEDAKGFKFLGWHNMPRGNVQVRLARMLMWSLTPCR
ncbi:MAG: hypothetical protein JO340_16110 [Acidobacteriaceae bacterium]|nr:hypothetical protein [Acidobacteriaceae bacterium]